VTQGVDHIQFNNENKIKQQSYLVLKMVISSRLTTVGSWYLLRRPLAVNDCDAQTWIRDRRYKARYKGCTCHDSSRGYRFGFIPEFILNVDNLDVLWSQFKVDDNALLECLIKLNRASKYPVGQVGEISALIHSAQFTLPSFFYVRGGQ